MRDWVLFLGVMLSVLALVLSYIFFNLSPLFKGIKEAASYEEDIPEDSDL